jgi:hypothetical protein
MGYFKIVKSYDVNMYYYPVVIVHSSFKCSFSVEAH